MTTCIVGVFVVLSMLTSARFDIVIKVAIAVFVFLIGLTMGAYLGSLISETWASIGGLVGGILAIIIMMSQSRGP